MGERSRWFAPGDVIKDRWTVRRFIGEGAFAEVYLAEHHVLGEQAVKVFKQAGLALTEVQVALQEPRLLAHLNHPHILRVFDADVTQRDGSFVCFFSTEYVDGGTLEDFWKSCGEDFVPIDIAVRLISQLADGLAVAHECNPPVVHRDIKPQNLLVAHGSTGPELRIADFGLAKTFNPMTLRLSGRGTYAFKPPEVLADVNRDSPAGDIWAAGTCLYVLLTDEFPFVEDFELADLRPSRFEKPLIPPSRFNVDVDADLDGIVSRCLAIEPGDRFANGSGLAKALHQWRLAHGLEPTRQSTPATIRSEQEGQRMANRALLLAKDVTQLSEAADLLAASLQIAPSLRPKFEYKLKLWQKGISA